MANKYLRSGAGGAGTGADWANAYTTIAAAASGMSAGDDLWVSEDHAESTAGAVTATFPGTSASPNRIICANHAGSVPPVSSDLATTATVSTTGGNAITLNGNFYCYGVIFQAASTGGAVSGAIILGATNNNQFYKSCVFRTLGAISATSSMGQCSIWWDNCTWKFAGANSTFNARGKLTWTNSTAVDSGGTLPTTLFSGNGPGIVFCEGVDFSALSAKTIVGSLSQSETFHLKDCKLPASITVSASQGGGIGLGEVYCSRVDSAGNYRIEKHNYAGDQTTETTIIRTGGASDGTQGISYKIVTTSTAQWMAPFTCIPITIWNDSTGSVTATVCGIWGGGAVPNNDEIWLEVQYLGSASDPQSSIVTSGKADILASGSACSSDGSTWGGSTTPFKMAVTFTAGQKGMITAYVKCAKTSSTFYVDPLITLS